MDIHKDIRTGRLTATGLQQYLETHGINDTDSKGWTLLATAVRAGHLKMVELLLKQHADPNTKSHGFAPIHLAVTAKAERLQIISLLHSAKADLNAQDPDGNTAIISAVEQTQDDKVIRLLRRLGANLDAQGRSGKTAKQLAESSNNMLVRQAVQPDRPILDRLRTVTWIVNVVVGAFRYVVRTFIQKPVYKIFDVFKGRRQAPPQPAQAGPAIKHPQTEAGFKKSLDSYIEDSCLDKFFSPGSKFLQEVSQKAAKLKDDPRNKYKPDQIKDLTRVALYQPVLYCDDSSSMREEMRWEAQRELVKRITNIATQLVPEDKGVHLRFINRAEPGWDDLRSEAIEENMTFEPSGNTQIGTKLRDKILQPFIYDVLNRGIPLERPYLIMMITDGCPTAEAENTLKDVVMECGRKLREKGYERQAVMFQISQIGNDQGADNFLKTLMADESALNEVLRATAEKLDEKYESLRKNERELEEWVRK
ncbi:ankyrin repeat protein [Aspergillus fumigatus Af293]|uniref:Ankyrin repeat protein n=1 Tax=Aspergillus fumigatus (strain ATCC MYA-4609 / CBS 101355 / FGSC A1100 / Af293) TaxID=330879 RepID=Q4WGT9_ASPFU|nr:ankyrin repeat protein [Aspergillus fumigatus Af293]EAL86852.2 ankyrin repeat protein [Aspergillus fumigatus Af293]